MCCGEHEGLIRFLSVVSGKTLSYGRFRGVLEAFFKHWGLDAGVVARRVPRFWERPGDLVRFLEEWCRDRGVDEDEFFGDLSSRIFSSLPKAYVAPEDEIRRMLEDFFRSRGVDVGEVYEKVPRFWERREDLVRFLEGKGVPRDEVPLWVLAGYSPEVDRIFREEAERQWRMVPKFLRDRYERWSPRVSEVEEEIRRLKSQIDERCRSEGLSKEECLKLRFEASSRVWRRFYLEYCGVEDPWSLEDQLLDSRLRRVLRNASRGVGYKFDENYLSFYYSDVDELFYVTVRVDGKYYKSVGFADVDVDVGDGFKVSIWSFKDSGIFECEIFGDLRCLFFAVRPYYSPKWDYLFTPLDIINYDWEKIGPLELHIMSEEEDVLDLNSSGEYRYVFLCFDKFLEKFFKPYDPCSGVKVGC
ncbi:MAG: hypothetical protein DRN81_04635 [Thermoproteota archaeon]|nr:MAG: hypothetical protein DRN81_04635 [Candidatus Korarchaeota archaeon]